MKWGGEMPRQDIEGFGLVHLKVEGAPIHPDDIDADMSDEYIKKQAKVYFDYHRKAGRPEELLSQESLYIKP